MTTRTRRTTMKRTLIALCAFAALCAGGATKWKNLDDKSHLAGGKTSETDLLGKAVMVFYWDVAKQGSTDYLPNVEKVWSSFKTKKFRVLGNHIGEKNADKVKAALAKGKVTFPVYQNATVDPDPKPGWQEPPYFLVLNHRGTVVYSGAGEKDAIEKAVDAMSSIGMPITLCEDVTFKKFKGLAKQIKLGKNLTSVVKKLEKATEGRDSSAAAEAQEILAAIDGAKDDVKSDIELYTQADPAEAINLINLFIKTWPKDESAKGYKDSLSDLRKAAKERAKAAREKAKGK